MGRGSGNKAVTAHGLLFGPRSRGAGPQDQRVRIPLSEARRGPVLAEACKEAGVIAPEIDSDELFAEKKAYFVVDRSDQGQGSYTIALTRDARWLAGATLSYDDVSFGGAKASLASVKVEGGDKEIAGLRDLEEALCEPLREAGFDYLEFELSGREAVERFDRGEPIDLAAMS